MPFPISYFAPSYAICIFSATALQAIRQGYKEFLALFNFAPHSPPKDSFTASFAKLIS